MAIALTDLPETELIVRGKFPPRDETAFDREAAKFTTASGCMTEAQTAVIKSSGYTAEEFHGRTGGSMVTKLGDHHDTFGVESKTLTSTAGWLTLAAENVRNTKNAINAAVERYHDAYAAKCKEAHDNSWPQTDLKEAKEELVREAQQEIDTLWSNYEARHEQIRQGIVNGADAPDNLSAVADTDTPGSAQAGVIRAAGYRPGPPQSPEEVDDDVVEFDDFGFPVPKWHFGGNYDEDW
ncbi:hypothetical protein [Mycolicibacterium sp.]|uniref:hypothetical protein n=1 Tax=Mycolicibacterium sp. TaxID=2320850 RepID=UPI0037C715AC